MLSELFLQAPTPRLAFLVCVRIASHRRDTSWWLRRATRAELEGVPGGEMIAVARSMEVSAGAKATSAPVAHAHNFPVATMRPCLRQRSAAISKPMVLLKKRSAILARLCLSEAPE